jgi:hypothetical protein
VFIFLFHPISLLLIFGGYALSAPMVWLWRKLFRRRARTTPTPA